MIRIQNEVSLLLPKNIPPLLIGFHISCFILVSFSGNMDSKCSCTKHKELVAGSAETLTHTYKLSSRKFPASVVSRLISENLLSKRSVYLCNVCASYVRPTSPVQSTPHCTHAGSPSEEDYIPKVKLAKTDCFEEVLTKIRSGEASNEQLATLAFELGKGQRNNLMKHCDSTRLQYTNICKNADIANIHNNADLSVCRKFLEGLAFDKNMHGLSEKKIDCLNTTLEHMVHLRHLGYIGPISFAKNLISYFTVKSRQVSNLLSYDGPFGSYTTVIKWIREQGMDPLMCPNGDVITFFDNNQVVGKQYGLSFNAKCHASVMTTLIHIMCQSHLQYELELSPNIWLTDFNLPDNGIELYIDMQHKSQEMLSQWRDAAVLSTINNLMSKTQSTNKPPSPEIDNDHVTMAEPLMVNPNSYTTVQEVLQHIKVEFI